MTTAIEPLPAQPPRRAPGPRSRYPGELFFRLNTNRLGFMHQVARDYGDLARIDVVRTSLFLATHPDLVKDVLVTNNRLFGRGRGHLRMKLLLGDSLLTTDGDVHRRQRRLVQPAFHRQRVGGDRLRAHRHLRRRCGSTRRCGGMGRRALAPHTLAGYDIPRGSLVVVSPFITQRDERFFPSPESLRPERWLEDQADRLRSMACE